MASNLSLLSQIAANISANAAKLDEYLTINNLPQPSFALDAPLGFESLLKDPQAAQARAALMNDGRKLQLLMLGPAEAGRVFGLNVLDLKVLQH
jgi:hypothetical protein